MPALACDLKIAVFGEVKGNVHGHKISDIGWALVHEHADGFLVAEPGAGNQRILIVKARCVVTGDGRGNAPWASHVLEISMVSFARMQQE
jgi:hypothetical protein